MIGGAPCGVRLAPTAKTSSSRADARRGRPHGLSAARSRAT